MDRTICIDFDGVIHKYSKGYQDGSIYDEPVTGVFDAMQKILDEKFKVIIFTTRQDKEGIYSWLVKYAGKELADKIEINTSKPPAMYYIDDRGFRFTNWKDIMNYLR